MRFVTHLIRDDAGERGYSIFDTLREEHIALCDTSTNAHVVCAAMNTVHTLNYSLAAFNVIMGSK